LGWVLQDAFAALIAAEVSFMRMFGVGLRVVVLMDATWLQAPDRGRRVR
jgi:hypothetical protein